jgi:hypothetical protein
MFGSEEENTEMDLWKTGYQYLNGFNLVESFLTNCLKLSV